MLRARGYLTMSPILLLPGWLHHHRFTRVGKARWKANKIEAHEQYKVRVTELRHGAKGHRAGRVETAGQNRKPNDLNKCLSRGEGADLLLFTLDETSMMHLCP